MTRKDYIIIAEALHNAVTSRYAAGDEHGVWSIADAATHVAQALALDNARFDQGRFLAACGVA